MLRTIYPFIIVLFSFHAYSQITDASLVKRINPGYSSKLLQEPLIPEYEMGKQLSYAYKSINDIDANKSAKTYLDLMINMVSTDFYYGNSNSTLKDYKKPNNGVQAGVSFQGGITPGFSLVTELYFVRKGGKLLVNNPLTNDESNFRLNTFELPVLARLHLGKLYLNAGPSVAYTISGKRKIAEVSTKLSFNDSPEGIKHLEAGMQIGGGIEFPFKEKRIVLDIRYNHGMTNISHNKEMFNRGLMISVHFSKAWKSNPLNPS